MGEGKAYVDGRYCSIGDAKISVLDPGFTHSDVIYDVTSTWKGTFFRLDEHVARFLKSCAGLNLVCPYGTDEVKRILATCVHDGGVEDAAYVSMALTRGPYTKDGERSRNLFKTIPNFIAYAIPYVWIAAPDAQERGLHLIVARTPRIPDACVDMHLKNYHWGDLTRGKFEAHAAGADAAVLCTIDGYLAEGAGFNLFFAKNGRLFTPARNVLEGVTRQSVIDLAADSHVPCELGDYRATDLREADEAFITSTAGGVMPVVKVDSRTFGSGSPGALSMKFREEYWRRREEGWLGTPVRSLLNEGVR